MWQPAWGIRTALLGVQGFMSARAEAATGVASVDYPIEERIRLAKKSRGWACSDCGKSNVELLPDGDPDKSRKKEELPEGLVVDATGGKGGEQTDGGTEAAGSGLAAQASQSQAMAASPSEGAQSAASASAMLASVSSEGPRAPPGSSGLAATPLAANSGSSASLLPPADQSMDRAASSTSQQSMSRASSRFSTLSDDQSTSAAPYQCNNTNQPAAPTAPQPPQAHTSALSPLQRAPPPPPQQQQPSSRPQAPHPRPLSIPSPSAATIRPVPPGGPDTSPDGQPLPPLPLIRRGVPAEDLPAPRRPTRSEARVAQLDRAILTVVLLLCGLVVRRLI